MENNFFLIQKFVMLCVIINIFSGLTVFYLYVLFDFLINKSYFDRNSGHKTK